MGTLIQEAYFSGSTARHSSHFHDCHQLLLITKGQAEIRVNNTQYRAGAGQVILFSRLEHHAVRILTAEYERFVLRLDPVASGDSRLYSLLSNRPSGFSHIVDTGDLAPAFIRLFTDITREFSSHNILSEELLRLLTQELMILLYRVLPVSPPAEEHFHAVADLQRRFEREPQASYSLESLARAYGISVSSLSHQFKQITGSSVMGYLQSCRLAAAKHLLTHTTLSIGEIVERCGFSDNSNFSRTFRRIVGISPTAFRHRYTA